MRKNAIVPRVTAALLGAVSLASAPSAHAAAVACSSYPNPVYVTGASVAKPLVQALATAVEPLGVSIIYQNPDSCLGLQDLLLNQPSTEGGISTLYLNPNGTTTACTLSSTNPQTPDIAVSEVYASTCGYGADAGTNGLVEVLGPINAMVFAVPGGATSPSSATSISAEAAQVVFGYDTTQGYIVQPWNQSADIFVREQTSGSEAMIGVAIGLPTSKWINAATSATPPPQQQGTSAKMVSAIQAAAASNPSATIGVLGSENVYSANAAKPSVPLNILAYQQTGQACGYFPSSTGSALDEINVRQGRYAIWGPMHVFAHVDGSGSLTSPNTPSDESAVAAVLNFFLATGPNPDTTPLYSIGSLASAGEDSGAVGADGGATISTADKQAFISAEANPGYVVPWCAMEVLRTGEMGPEASYQSPEPCSCFFEVTAQGAPISGHTCTSCNTDNDCADASTNHVCRYGFCEVQ